MSKLQEPKATTTEPKNVADLVILVLQSPNGTHSSKHLRQLLQFSNYVNYLLHINIGISILQ